MLLNIPYRSHSSRRRGGTFFTMCLFMMTLVSTGLMYYYFQRSKVLQKEITELKSSGVFSSASAENRPANDQPEAATTVEPPTTHTPANESAAAPAPAQTPAPGFAALDTSLTTQPARDVSSMGLAPVDHSDIAPPAPDGQITQTSPETDERDNPPANASGSTAEQRPVQSLYDTMTPAVRVRSPRQNQ